MSQKENDQGATRNHILTPQERTVCEQITTREAPHNQRAMALLALDEKRTQAQAAEQAGLTAGQVRYLAAQFRKLGMSVFPATLLDEISAESEVSTEGKTKGKKSKKPTKAEKKARKAEKKAAKKEARRAADKMAKNARKAVEQAKKVLKEAIKAAKKAERKARKLRKG